MLHNLGTSRTVSMQHQVKRKWGYARAGSVRNTLHTAIVWVRVRYYFNGSTSKIKKGQHLVKIWPKSVFESVGFHQAQIFRKFKNFSKNFGLMKPHTAIIVVQKCNKKEKFGGQWNPTKSPPPQEYLCSRLNGHISYCSLLCF